MRLVNIFVSYTTLFYEICITKYSNNLEYHIQCLLMIWGQCWTVPASVQEFVDKVDSSPSPVTSTPGKVACMCAGQGWGAALLMVMRVGENCPQGSYILACLCFSCNPCHKNKVKTLWKDHMMCLKLLMQFLSLCIMTMRMNLFSILVGCSSPSSMCDYQRPLYLALEKA